MGVERYAHAACREKTCYEEVFARISSEDDIRTHDWGETSFYGVDPWGNHVCFIAAGTEFSGGRFVE